MSKCDGERHSVGKASQVCVSSLRLLKMSQKWREKCAVQALPSHSLRGCGSKRAVLLYFCPVGHVCALHCLLLGGLVACCYVKCMKMNVLDRRPGPAHEACPLRHVGPIRRHTPRRSDLNLAAQWARVECPTHAKAQLSARLQ